MSIFIHSRKIKTNKGDKVFLALEVINGIPYFCFNLLVDSGAVKAISRRYPMKTSEWVIKLIDEANDSFIERGIAALSEEIDFTQKLNAALNNAALKGQRSNTSNDSHLSGGNRRHSTNSSTYYQRK